MLKHLWWLPKDGLFEWFVGTSVSQLCLKTCLKTALPLPAPLAKLCVVSRVSTPQLRTVVALGILSHWHSPLQVQH